MENVEYKKLSKQETYDLITKAKNGDIEARNKLMLNNIPLVRNIVGTLYDYQLPTLQFEDMENIGIMSIINAINVFDISKNNSFSSYLYPTIKNTIKLEYYKLKNEEISLETVINNSDDIKYLDLITDNDNNIEELYEKKELLQFVNKELKNLSEKEKNILYLHYYKKITLNEIAKLYGIKSRERIRQIEKKSLIQLKKAY